MSAPAVADRPKCARCGSYLSRYRSPDDPPDLCRPCAARSELEAVPDPPARVLDPDRLLLAVAGALALGAALRPGDRVHVQAELERFGVLTDNDAVHKAVEKLRRRGWLVSGVAGEAGYLFHEWRYRFRRRRRGPQLRLFR